MPEGKFLDDHFTNFVVAGTLPREHFRNTQPSSDPPDSNQKHTKSSPSNSEKKRANETFRNLGENFQLPSRPSGIEEALKEEQNTFEVPENKLNTMD